MKYFMSVLSLMLFIPLGYGETVNTGDEGVANFTITDVATSKQPPGIEIKINHERDINTQGLVVRIQITNRNEEPIIIDKKLLVLSVRLQRGGEFCPAWSLPIPDFQKTMLETGKGISFSINIAMKSFNECQFFVSVSPFLFNRVGIEIHKKK